MSFPLLKTALFLVLFLSGAASPLLASVREIATVTTSAGTLEFELYTDVSPRTVANFKYLADTRFYDGTAFHRLIRGFMIQGGCPNTRNDSARSKVGTYGQGGPEYTIPDEPTTNPNRTHVRGVLSMAKTGAPNSGGSQFFIMFGDAPHLDNVHAPMGFLVNGSAVLTALEAKSLVKDALGADSSVPTDRLVVTSIRIRSEITGETPRYQNGTAGGLLRNTDRSTMGKYNIALNSSGVFSGRFDYWGRQCSFLGKLPLLSSAQLEKEAVVLSDASSGTPLRVRVRVRQSASLKNSVSVSVCAVNTNGTDVADSTLVSATSEIGASTLANPALPLASRYNAWFAPPMTNTGALAVAELRGSAFLSLGVSPATGLCTVYGRLPDNRTHSFSHPVSNEGGRLSLSLHFHDLIPLTPAQLTQVAGLTLTDLPNVGYLFRLVGTMELPDKTGALPQGPTISSYFFWQRAAQTTGAVKSQINAFLLPTITPWTAPRSGVLMAPFTTGVSPKITLEGSAAAAFQVSKTNTTATFVTPSAGTLLKFNPFDGTFDGSFLDSSSAGKPRRTMQGVLLQGAGTQNGAGFALTGAASIPVSIAP